MMDFTEFTEAVQEKICEEAEGNFDVLIREGMKNNTVRMTGIYVRLKDSNIGPCVYLDKFYEEYIEEGMEFGEIVDEIYRLLIKYLDDMPDMDMSDFLNWETAKNNVYAKLVNAEQNQALLGAVPHRRFLDLAVVYYVSFEGEDGQRIGMEQVSNKLMGLWEQDEEMLYQTAMENMHAEGEAVFVTMETVIKQIYPKVDIPEEVREYDAGMYILTNSHKKYGASELLDKNTLRMIADQLGDGYVVLPSSLHETIILPSRMVTGYKQMAEMVRIVNDTEVMEEERLSYHVYVYSREEDALQIAA